MAQVNLLEAKTDLPKLIQLLETHHEEAILITKDGTPVVEMKLAKRKPTSKRIGVAKASSMYRTILINGMAGQAADYLLTNAARRCLLRLE